MKILVISDTHGDSEILNKLRMKHYDVDFFFHLGDSQLPNYLLNSYCAVKGNCDYIDLPISKEFEIEGLKFHLEHGNNYNFIINPISYIKELNCDVFLIGHTHKKLATKIDNTYVFNPGSTRKPRDGDKGSYSILEVKNKEILKYTFMEIEL